MMSSENIPPATEPQQASGTRKPANQRGQPPEQPPIKCPRCDSANTKFCYYNNYSLSQPRHFCKTCRRYWTKGGALRNVPIGGGCRKTKKLKPSSAATTTASRLLSALDPTGPDFGPGVKFTAPAMEFQLGGLALPRLHPATAGVYTQFVAGGPPGCFGLDLLGLNYPNSSGSTTTGNNNGNTTSSCVVNNNHHQENNNISLSSIESLSSINQEMHWKLQQQRLALIYGNQTDGGDDHDQNQKVEKDKCSTVVAMNLFQNLEVNNNNQSRVSMNSDHDHHQPTEWFFDDQGNNNNNYGPNSEMENGGVNLNGVQAAAVGNWGDLHHFNGLH